MLCCMHCFNDKEIKQIILSARSMGRCSYCGKKDVAIADPNILSEQFEFLILLLEKDDKGEKASSVLQKSFSLFDDNVKNRDKLVSDILGCKSYLSDKFVINARTEEYDAAWNELCHELKSENRFFLKSNAKKTIFSTELIDDNPPPFISILDQLETLITEDQEFFRARISDSVLSKEQMGAPPAIVAASGRANPKGISYLYLASNVDTCISEVRPYNGCEVYVSNFKPKRDQKIIDLTTPRKSVSIIPFSESDYIEVLSIIELLESFAKALSIPVKPHLSELDYLPTQFLCEYIKSLGSYDGIVFNSSFGEGSNYVFFDTMDFNIEDPDIYQLTSTNFSFSIKS